MQIEDEVVVKKCQNGDLSQFAFLYDKYIQKIYSYIYFRTHHRETAEDLASLTFTKALENIHSFKAKKGMFAPWLYKIAKNTIYDHYRSFKTQYDIETAWNLHSDENIPKDVHMKVEIEKAKKCLEILKPKQRDIVIMRLWDGLSYKEIAEIMDDKEVNLKVAFSRAIAVIRDNEAFALILILPVLWNIK